MNTRAQVPAFRTCVFKSRAKGLGYSGTVGLAVEGATQAFSVLVSPSLAGTGRLRRVYSLLLLLQPRSE